MDQAVSKSQGECSDRPLRHRQSTPGLQVDRQLADVAMRHYLIIKKKDWEAPGSKVAQDAIKPTGAKQKSSAKPRDRKRDKLTESRGI